MTDTANRNLPTSASSTSSSPQQPQPFYLKEHVNYIIKLSKKALSKSSQSAAANDKVSSASTATPASVDTHTPTSSSAASASASAVDEDRDSLESVMSQHLRMSGIYWCTTSLAVMNQLHLIPRQLIIPYVLKCYKHQYTDRDTDESKNNKDSTTAAAGAAAAAGGVDISRSYYSVDELDTFPYRETLIRSIMKLYNTDDGSWCGDHIYREVDTRFTYCAVLCLSLLHALPSALNGYDETYITVEQLQHSIEWLNECRNYDGGYGAVPGAESHSGQIFTAVAAKTIIYAHIGEKLGHGQQGSSSAYFNDHIMSSSLAMTSNDILCSWLCDRQIDYGTRNEYTGGLNGRPEKLVDVCYSFWVLASLACMKRRDWIDKEALIRFILRCQDIDIIDDGVKQADATSEQRVEGGGIADRPNNQSDPFHTFFGIAALSLLDYNPKSDATDNAPTTSTSTPSPLLQPISPQYALPMYVLEKMKLPNESLTRD
jgi:geranylgeranyl transferase type-2 subunit beta